MFGGKNKKQEQSYQNPPVEQGIAQAFNNQVMQNPLNIPNIYQEQVQVPQAQQQPKPIYQQQVQQPQKQAIIIKAELHENGEYYYVLVTDYQLNLGNCEVRNI